LPPDKISLLPLTQEKYLLNIAFTYSDQCWDDSIDSPGDELETVDVILLGETAADEREY